MTADLGSTLFSTRALAEYRAMFALTDVDLAGRVLDCPGGAASFTAEVCAGGGDATAVDVAYKEPPDQLVTLACSEADRGNAYMAANASRYVWSYYPNIEAHDRARRGAAGRFGGDITTHPERYVAAALPSLPFGDRSFDLVLSGHLLFTYTDRLTPAFHLQALIELARVACAEVRVFPLLEHTGRSDPRLVELLRGQLTERGIDSEVRPVRYELQRGGNQMLVLHRNQAPNGADT